MLRIAIVCSVVWVAMSFCACRHIEQSSLSLRFEDLHLLPAEELFDDLDCELRARKAMHIDSLFKRLQRLTGFNGVVLYAEKGHLIYQQAFGYEDPLRKRKPLSIESRFELASVSKMFTATAILQLKEQGKIDLDTDIREYIPEWPYENITTRLLLNHRSGLSRYESLADEYWPDKTVFLTNDAMIRLYMQYRPAPYFKPNGGFHYCNINYALLASIVERVTGVRFADYMMEHVFIPAHMTHSEIYQINNEGRLNGYRQGLVPGYDSRGRRLVSVPDDYLNGVVGDKVMISTVSDLYNFEIALNTGVLLSESSLKETYSSGSPAYRRRKDNYGFGWRIRTEADSAVYHYGWWKGFRSFFIRDLAQQKTLIVLSNKAKGPGADHFWKLINDTVYELPKASAYYLVSRQRIDQTIRPEI